MLALGLGVLMLVVGWQEHRESTSLKRDGVETVAAVVDIELSTGQKTGELNSYLPVLEWTAEDGRRIVRRAGFGSHDPKAFHIGDRFRVYYDPAAPDSRFYVPYPGKSWARWLLDNLAFVVGGVFLASGAGMLWRCRS